ncbi:MAG: transglutaminase domain-containing protein [Phycisphaerales bacterium]|nr:transglutaminase domain-containing protein [Phycisphaerales bacterium]
MNRWTLIVPAALAACLPAAAALAEGGREAFERWYVVEMQGRRVGWMREAQNASEPRGTITTSAELRITIARGGDRVALSLATESVETRDGRPVSMRSEQDFGGLITTTWVFPAEPGGPVRQTVTGSGRTTDSEQPWPAGEFLMPAAARRRIGERLAAGDPVIETRTLDPLSGLAPVTTTATVIRRAPAEALGRTVPGVEWRTTTSALPGAESTEFVDERGMTIRSTMQLGGVALTITLADEALAKAPADPPELLVSTLVKPDGHITNPRTLVHARFRLSMTEGDLPDLPSEGMQIFKRQSPRAGEVIIDMPRPRPLEAPPTPEQRARWLAATAAADAKDPEILALAQRATKDADADPLGRARAVRRAVFDHLSRKSLSVGFASASEAVRTREGDCTEHAVLLVAALRAAGIPARAVSGLVYVERFGDGPGQTNVFGYHMWAQALIEDRGKWTWRDLDAALDRARDADATHLALGYSSLADDEILNSMVTLATVIGRLKIDVLPID